jgi:RimJ/RimL family protein N-acetyltransferase
MQDGVVRLEPLGAAHLEGLAELGPDPDVQRFTHVPSPWEDGFERTWVQRYNQDNGGRPAFAIVDDSSGEFLGMAALVRLDRAAREGEIGYIVAPAARGRGVAVRALQLLTDWAFGELALERVELRIDVENEASLRVAERAGFTREGVLRSLHFKQGARADVAVFSRLGTDG